MVKKLHPVDLSNQNISEKKYRAVLTKVPKEDADFLKCRSCIMTISVGQEYHEGEKLRASLRVTNERFRDCTIAVCDTLQRYTIGLISGKDAEECYAESYKIGNEWLERNLPIIEQELKIPYKVFRWEHWFGNEKFLHDLERVKELYSKSHEYKGLVDKSVQDFIARQSKYREIPDHEGACRKSLDYLIEESACMVQWIDEGYDYEIYPPIRNIAISKAFELLRPGKYQGTVAPIGVNFLDYNEDDDRQHDKSTLEAIIQNVPGHVYWKNKHGVFLGCNKRQAKTFNLSKNVPVIGKSDFDFYDKTTAMEIRKNDIKVMSSLKTQVVEEVVNKDGSVKVFLSHKVPLQDKHSAVVGLVGVSLDITKQKELETELKAKNDALRIAVSERDEFLRNMTHEIKTPIACAIKTSKNLRDNWARYNDEERLAQLDSSVKSNERLKDVMMNILDLSKFQSGNMKYDKAQYSFKKAILDVVAEFTDENSRIKLDLPSEELEGIFDHYRIEQAIRNLISNALSYGGNGEVKVKAWRDGEMLKFSVTDNGVGVPEAELEKIFEIFIQSTRTKTQAGGTGMGLAISRSIVSAHDGKVWAENNKNESGATFSFEIKAGEVEVSSPKKEAPKEIQIKSDQATALVIDDDETVLAMTSLILEAMGFRVIMANSGLLGIQMLKDNKDLVDVVLLDMMMPDIYGLDALKEIRKDAEIMDSRIYIHTSLSDDDKDVIDAKEIGIEGVIGKNTPSSKMQQILGIYLK